jgi:hypothetical protein
VLEVKMRDGTPHRRNVRAVYGSPEAPLPIAALVEKFVDCGRQAQRAQPENKLRRVASTILALEQESNLRSVLSRL